MSLRVRSCGLLAGALFAVLARGADPEPLARAHAHNDYEHPRPLLDALDQGFCSVEADVHLVDGQLLVAHDRAATKPDRTLRTLYLQPLQDRVRRHGGRVFPGGPSVWLLIDFKTEAEPTYAALRRELADFAEMLTEFRPEGIRTNAVTVVISGNRPTATVSAEARRWVGIDGRLPDLAANPSPTLMPLVSDNWSQHFTWRGSGPLSDPERERLHELVRKAHAQGRRLRFWALADTAEAWRVGRDAGVDLLNTDDLAGLAAFLRGPGRGN